MYFFITHQLLYGQLVQQDKKNGTIKILPGLLLTVMKYKVPAWWFPSSGKLLIFDTSQVCPNSLDNVQTGHHKDLAHNSGIQKKGCIPQWDRGIIF